MQRTKEELESMTHDDLVLRVLELQDILREGLAVRDSLHRVLNSLLKAKADEVERVASTPDERLDADGRALKEAWARARHAVSNPSGAARHLVK